MNADLVGKEYPSIAFVVDTDRVRAFANAIGAPAPEEAGVPPTFATAVEFAGFPAATDDPELGLDFSRVVHSEQVYEWHRPMEIGETLTATLRLASIREKGGLGFLVIETDIQDVDGATVVTGFATLVERST